MKTQSIETPANKSYVAAALIALLIGLALSLIAPRALARAELKQVRKQAGRQRVAPAMPAPKLGTDFRFRDVTVHGRYESPNEGIVTVEDNKTLGDLLDYRTNYKNRLNQMLANETEQASDK